MVAEPSGPPKTCGVAEPPRKHHHNREGDYVHELCSREHHIAYGDRMTEKERR